MSLMSGPPSKQQGKSRFFDLKGSYRQCAVNPLSACFAHIAVFDPTAKTTFAFRMRALPFGSVKSVHSFLRVAHSLCAILVKEFMVVWTNYFDDFVFAKADEMSSVTGSIKFVFKALGWLFAADGDKAPDYSHSVSALGVQIDVQNMHRGVVKTDNTAGRKGDLLQILDDVMLCCRLLQVSSRVVSPGSPSMWLPSMCGEDLDDPTVSALQLHRTFISSSAPRTLDVSKSGVWFSSPTHVLILRFFLGLELCLLTATASYNTSSLKRFVRTPQDDQCDIEKDCNLPT